MLASGSELIEDMTKAPDDALSLNIPLIEVFMLPRTLDSHSYRFFQYLQSEYTLDLLELDNEYHVDVIRSNLTRSITDTFKEVHDELIKSLDASIPVHGDGMWKIRSQKGDSLNSGGTQLGSKFPLSKRCNV